MQASDIPVKTPLGLAELAAAGSGLPKLMLSLLRWIDGNLPVSRYVALLPQYGDVAVMIDTMQELGLVVPKVIEPQRTGFWRSGPAAVAGRAAPPAQPVAPVAQAAAARPVTDLALVRAKLLDLMNTGLGMDALDLMLRVESARDVAALQATRAAAQAAFIRARGDWPLVKRLYDSL